MSDAQLTAAIAALGGAGVGLIGFLKWCFTQWLADRKEERAERKADREADRAATIQVATAMATMATKFDAFERQLARIEDNVDEISGVHAAPVVSDGVVEQRRTDQRRNTPAMGHRIPRPATDPASRPLAGVGVYGVRATSRGDDDV